MPRQQSHGSIQPLADSVAGLLWVSFCFRCLAYPHELLVRRFGTIGRAYRSRPESAIGVLLVPFLMVVLVKPLWGSGWVVIHWLILILASALHNLMSVRKGHVHSKYLGDARIGGNEARWGETVLGFAIGFALLALCPTVGACQLLGAFCSRIHLDSIRIRDRRMLEAMRDAQWEAEVYADMMRRGK